MCKWKALDKIHLPTQSSETNSLSILMGNCYTSHIPATSLMYIHKHTWSWIQSCELTGKVFLGFSGFASGPMCVKHQDYWGSIKGVSTACFSLTHSHPHNSWSTQTACFILYRNVHLQLIHMRLTPQNTTKIAEKRAIGTLQIAP